MASHAIFQYNVLAINDTHNTWTNMIVKMTILRLLGSSDDKEKIGVARPKGQRPESSSIQEHRKNRRQGIGASGGSRKNRRHDTLVQKGIETRSAYRHRLNRRSKKEASVHWASYVPETMSSAQKKFLQHRFNRWGIGVMTSAVRKRSFSSG